MLTPQERLETVEFGLKQFKTETIKAYGEVAIEKTMVKGLTEDGVKRLASLKTQVEQHSAQVEQRFIHVEQRFEHVDIRLDGMDAHLESIDTRMGRVEKMLAQILTRLPEKP